MLLMQKQNIHMWPDAAVLRIASGTKCAAVLASHQEVLLSLYVLYPSEGKHFKYMFKLNM